MELRIMNNAEQILNIIEWPMDIEKYIQQALKRKYERKHSKKKKRIILYK